MKFRRNDDGTYQRRKVTLLGWKGKEGKPEERAKLVRAEAQSEIPDVFSAVDFVVLEDGSIEGWITLDENFVMAPRFFEAIAKPIEVLVKAWLEPAPDATDQTEQLVKQKLTVEIESGFEVSVHEPNKGLLDLREGASDVPFTLKITVGESKPAANLRVRCRVPSDEQPSLEGQLSEDEGTTDESGLVAFRYQLDEVALPEGEAPGVSFEVLRIGVQKDHGDVKIGTVSLVAAPRVTLRIEKPGLSEEPDDGAVLEYDPELALGGTLLLKPRACIKVAGKRYESENVVRDARIFVEESGDGEPLAWNEERLAYELVLRSSRAPSPFTQAPVERSGIHREPSWLSIPIDSGGDGGANADGGPLAETLTDVMRASELLVARFGPQTGPHAVRGFIQALVDRAADATASELKAEVINWPECAARAAESHGGTVDTADAFDRSLTLHKYSYEMFLVNWIGFCVELFFGWFLDAAGYLARSGGAKWSSIADGVGDRVSRVGRSEADGAIDALAQRIRKRMGDAEEFFRREVERAGDAAREMRRKIDELRRPDPTGEQAMADARNALEELTERERSTRSIKEAFESAKQKRERLKTLVNEIEQKKSARMQALEDHRQLKRQLERASDELDALTAQSEKAARELDELTAREGPLRERLAEIDADHSRLIERQAELERSRNEVHAEITEGHRERTQAQLRLEENRKQIEELDRASGQGDSPGPDQTGTSRRDLELEADELSASLERARERIEHAQAELAESNRLRETLDSDQKELAIGRSESQEALKGIEEAKESAGTQIAEIEGAKPAPQTMLDEGRPRLEGLTERLESSKTELRELETERQGLDQRVAESPGPTSDEIAQADRDVLTASMKLDDARRASIAARVNEAKYKLEKEKLEAVHDIIESERTDMAALQRKSASESLTPEQRAAVLKDMRERRTRSTAARLSQLREHVIEHIDKDVKDLRPEGHELFDPEHNVLKNYSETRAQIQAIKDADPWDAQGFLGRLHLPMVSGLHGEAGEDGSKGAISGDDAAAQFEQKLKELDSELRAARESAALHPGGRLVPEEPGWFRWAIDGCAAGVSALLGMAVTAVYWVLVVASFGGVYFLFEGAKIVLSRLMAAIFANIFMAVRFFADKLDSENLKGPHHKHPQENIDRVKSRFASVQSLAGFFLDPRSVRGSKGDLSRVLLIVTAPEVYFKGNKNQDKASLLKRFSGAYDEYYDQQRRTFSFLVQDFASEALDPNAWARKDWPAARSVTPNLETLLAEAKDYEGDFLASRDGNFSSSGLRLLEGGEYSWQDIDQLIDWLVWMFGTAVRLAALVGALLMLVGTMGGSVLIVPGALVLADITEVVAMFIRSTYISLMAHNRVIGIQEDIVVTAALEHDARFGAGTGGDV